MENGGGGAAPGAAPGGAAATGPTAAVPPAPPPTPPPELAGARRPRARTEAAAFRLLVVLLVACFLVVSLLTPQEDDTRVSVLNEPSIADNPAACGLDGGTIDLQSRPEPAPTPLAAELGGAFDDMLAAPFSGALGALAMWAGLAVASPIAALLFWVHVWHRASYGLSFFDVVKMWGGAITIAFVLVTSGYSSGALLLGALFSALRYRGGSTLSAAGQALLATPTILTLNVLAALALGTVLSGSVPLDKIATAAGPLRPTNQIVEALASEAAPSVLDETLDLDSGGGWPVVQDDGCYVNGLQVPCCAPAPGPPLRAFLWVLYVTASWAAAMVGVGRQFIAAGAAAEIGLSPGGAEPLGSVLWGHCRNAFGPQAGTVALAAATALPLAWLRAWAAGAEDAEGDGWRAQVAAAGAVSVLVAAGEVAWCYSMVWAAATGKGFVEAGRAAASEIWADLRSTITISPEGRVRVSVTPSALSLVYGYFAANRLRRGGPASGPAFWLNSVVVLALWHFRRLVKERQKARGKEAAAAGEQGVGSGAEAAGGGGGGKGRPGSAAGQKAAAAAEARARKRA